MTKMEEKNFLDLDKMWRAIEEKWGRHMSILEFLYGPGPYDVESKIIEHEEGKDK